MGDNDNAAGFPAVLRAVGRYLVAGLSIVGQSYLLAGPATDDPESQGWSAPLPGHPERLVPNLAPSRAEQALWAQLALDDVP